MYKWKPNVRTPIQLAHCTECIENRCYMCVFLCILHESYQHIQNCINTITHTHSIRTLIHSDKTFIACVHLYISSFVVYLFDSLLLRSLSIPFVTFIRIRFLRTNSCPYFFSFFLFLFCG